MKKVNKYTRAGRKGKLIVCPFCKTDTRVFHFAWYSIMCSKCVIQIKKYDWLIETIEKVSNCCSEPVWDETDVCKKCGEHCEIINIKDF